MTTRLSTIDDLSIYDTDIIDSIVNINSTNPTPPSNEKISLIKQFLEDSNLASKAPFSACTFGNAFSGYEVFIGSGNAGPNGEPVDKTMYWRWASMTKLLGQLTLGAALEDGLIASIDEPVWTYIPEVGEITQYVSGSTAVLDGNGNPMYDNFGTPKYTQVLTSVTTPNNLGKKITIRMLMNSSSGFGYSFWGSGSTRNTFVNGLLAVPAYATSVQNYIAWLQNIESINGYGDTITSSYNNMPNITFTQSVNERFNYPLLCNPGETNIYDIGFTLIGAVISSALQKKGIAQTSAEYCKSRILTQIGITNVWFNCGSLNPPSDVNSKLTNAFFVRQAVPNDYSGSYKKGDNVNYDTLYSVFDANASGDGFTTQGLTVFLQTKTTNYLSNDIYAGGYDWSGAGTMSDYCKLIKLLINRGYDKVSEKQILTKQTVEWLLSSKYSATRLSYGLNAPNTNTISILNPSATWTGGYSKFTDGDIPFPCGTNTYTWGGYFGTTFYFDTKTGNYLVSGTQASAASWQLSTSTKPFQPNAAYIWKILTV